MFNKNAKALYLMLRKKEDRKVNWKQLAKGALSVAVSVILASAYMFWCGGWLWCAV